MALFRLAQNAFIGLHCCCVAGRATIHYSGILFWYSILVFYSSILETAEIACKVLGGQGCFLAPGSRAFETGRECFHWFALLLCGWHDHYSLFWYSIRVFWRTAEIACKLLGGQQTGKVLSLPF